MSKRKIVVALCAVIAICVLANIWCAFGQEQKGLDYEITFIEKLTVLVLTPLLWICVGTLIRVLIGIEKHVPDIVGLSMTILAVGAIIAYACAAVLYALALNIAWANIMTGWCIMHAPIFTVPGFLCGLSDKR